MNKFLLYACLLLGAASLQSTEYDNPIVPSQNNTTNVCISDQQRSWIIDTLKDASDASHLSIQSIPVIAFVIYLFTGITMLLTFGEKELQVLKRLYGFNCASALVNALIQTTIPVGFNGVLETRKDSLEKMIALINNAKETCPFSVNHSTGFCTNQENLISLTEAFDQYKNNCNNYINYNSKIAVIGSPIIGFINILLGFFIMKESLARRNAVLPLTNGVLPLPASTEQTVLFTQRTKTLFLTLFIFDCVAAFTFSLLNLFTSYTNNEQGKNVQAQIESDFVPCNSTVP